MKHLDLFSGIGGFALAASWVWGSQHELVSFCERDTFCQRVLKKHWPDVPCIDDIHDVRGEQIGAVDLLTGGFPCQPFSVAGKRRGSEDDRYLWPQMFRIIQEIQPRWVLGENVPGIVNLALDQVLADLESEGYEVQTFLAPACGVNAPHRRNRIWIIANNNRQRQQEQRQPVANAAQFVGSKLSCQSAPNAQSAECKFSRNTRERRTGFANGSCDDERSFSDAESEQTGRLFKRGVPANISASRDWTGQTASWSTKSPFCGVADGIPGRVDRLRSLGNAIVPQVAAVFLELMKQVDLLYNLN